MKHLKSYKIFEEWEYKIPLDDIKEIFLDTEDDGLSLKGCYLSSESFHISDIGYYGTKSVFRGNEQDCVTLEFWMDNVNFDNRGSQIGFSMELINNLKNCIGHFENVSNTKLFNICLLVARNTHFTINSGNYDRKYLSEVDGLRSGCSNVLNRLTLSFKL